MQALGATCSITAFTKDMRSFLGSVVLAYGFG
jgi:hypothetical protein